MAIIVRNRILRRVRLANRLHTFKAMPNILHDIYCVPSTRPTYPSQQTNSKNPKVCAGNLFHVLDRKCIAYVRPEYYVILFRVEQVCLRHSIPRDCGNVYENPVRAACEYTSTVKAADTLTCSHERWTLVNDNAANNNNNNNNKRTNKADGVGKKRVHQRQRARNSDLLVLQCAKRK